MTAYPSVNWWPGNLRPYESKLSVVVRFQELNGINSHRCLNFLSVSLDSDSALSQEEAVRLSEILHEALPDVLAIFSPSVAFANCGHYSPPQDRRDRHRVRYCDVCARRGYHSYLHELKWLSKCPFHRCELKDAWVRVHAGSVAAGHMAALKVVMQAHCRAWPYCDNSFPPRDGEHLSLLTDWVSRVSMTASYMSRREIWRSGDDGFLGSLSLAQAVGQLRALVPVPEVIESLLAEAEDTWGRESCQFPQRTRIALEHLRSRGLEFSRVLDFYKCIGLFSSTPPSFVTRAMHAQDCLRRRHGTCRCEWQMIREGWAPNWIKVKADERKHWSFRCPFDVAIAELDLCWAHQNSAHVGRNPSQKRVIFVELAHDMHAAGLIRYAKGSKISIKGYLNTEQEIATCCEWVHDSVLSDLLGKAADWEVEATHSAASRWLDSIDHGLQPGQRDDPKYCTRLCETDDGLSLIRWVKIPKGRPAVAHAPRSSDDVKAAT